MTKVKMTAKPRTKAIAPPLELTEAVKDGLERLGDPLGDVLALLDQSRLSDLLNRMGKTRRTRLLQRLHVPAMGRLTPTVCSHALTQLRSSRPPAQRLQDAETLGSPLFESLAQARAEWLEGRRSGALEESLEQAPRDELLLAAIAFWDADPSQTHVLAWTLQNRALPSWPAKEVETLARSCAQLSAEWGALYAVDRLSRAEAATDRSTPGPAIVLDGARQCDNAAERLEALLEQATGSARQAWESLGRRVLPDPNAWEPVQALHAMTGALVSALTAIDPANGTSFEVSVRLDSLLTALRHRGDELREREELLSGLARVVRVVTSQPHAAIDSLRAQADKLAGQAIWSEEDVNRAKLLTDVVALSDAVHRDDDLGVERLDERLRGALPEELRAVVLLVVRGKASFPADADMDRNLPAPRAPAASITLPEHESVDPELPATRGVSRDSQEADGPLVLSSATGTADPAAIEPLGSDLHEVPTPEGSTTLENHGATPGLPATADDQDSLSHETEPGRSHTARVSDAARATAFEAPPVTPQQRPSTPAPASKDENSPPRIILECLDQHEIALAYHAAQAAGFGVLAPTLKLLVLAETMPARPGPARTHSSTSQRLASPNQTRASARLISCCVPRPSCVSASSAETRE